MPQKLATENPFFVKELQALIALCPKQFWSGVEPVIAAANFGPHLYQPLVLEAENKANLATANGAEKRQLTISPPPLTDSEQAFVEMLRDYWAANGTTIHAGESLFVLRNLSRGKGVGFFESEGFYPDFILWHRRGDGGQRLVFVEPHGMRQDDEPGINNKVQIAGRIKDYLAVVLQAPGCPIHDVTAYIVSATPYRDLKRKHGKDWSVEKYAEHHILFPKEMSESERLGGLL